MVNENEKVDIPDVPMDSPSEDLIKRIEAGLMQSSDAIGKGEEHLSIMENTMSDICVLLNGMCNINLDVITDSDEDIQAEIMKTFSKLGLVTRVDRGIVRDFQGPGLAEVEITSVLIYLDAVYMGVVGYLRTGDIGEALFNARHKVILRGAQLLYGIHLIYGKFGIHVEIEKFLMRWKEELEWYSRVESPWDVTERAEEEVESGDPYEF